LRVVIDASVIVGAALKNDSTPMRALLAVLEHHSIVLSTTVFTEISEVLGRQKFAAAVTPERRQEILALLTTAATWIEPDLTVTDCVAGDRQRGHGGCVQRPASVADAPLAGGRDPAAG